jgi:hypothetical protein
MAARVSVDTQQIRYTHIQDSCQDKEQGMQTCTTMCPTTLDPASQLRGAPRLPHVQWLHNPPP